MDVIKRKSKMAKMGNKGQVVDLARKTIFWTIALIAITAVLLSFAVTVVNYKNKIVQVPGELQTELIALRFTNLEECFAVQDPNTKKAVPGVIDLKKFTDEQLGKCYPLKDKETSDDYDFRLRLLDEKVEVKTKGYANNDKFSFNKGVLLYKDGKLVKDILMVNVQNLKIGQ